MFVDIEETLVSALGSVSGVRRVGTSTPVDLVGACPMVQVQRIGGADDHLTDTARVDVDCFATTKDAARLTARIVHAALLALRHRTADGALLDTVDTVQGPMWVNYDDEHVQRYVATYEIGTRFLAST